ncbi:Collagen alpha-1(XII) chain [Clonorchis sinensis]|uniref:Collagen alpha-1(XII) chain n=1 Tax=Clonorchis sinensis TaxID=79923 RepID=A0A419PDG0_CLOSI|nr:Collagen alpha-1(XII) chain [Clonorchis sinensis]
MNSDRKVEIPNNLAKCGIVDHMKINVKPINIEVQPLKGNEITGLTIQWGVYDPTSIGINEYELVIYQERLVVLRMHVEQRFQRVSGLKAATSYWIEIIPLGKRGQVGLSGFSCATTEANLTNDKLRGFLTAIPKANGLNIRGWIPDSEIKHYMLSFVTSVEATEYRTVPAKSQNYELRGLKPCSFYYIELEAIKLSGEKMWKMKTCGTPKPATSNAVTNLRVENTLPHFSQKVTWQMPSEIPQGCLYSFSMRYEPQYQAIQNAINVAHGGPHLMLNLRPETQYTYYVRFHLEGSQQTARVVKATKGTLKKWPVPQKIAVTPMSNGLQVHWDRITTLDLGEEEYFEILLNGIVATPVKLGDYNSTINGLTPCHQYTVSLVWPHSSGASMRAEAIGTPWPSPLKPVKGVQVTAHGETGHILQWKRPKGLNQRCREKYTIRMGPIGGEKQDIDVENEQSKTFENLTPDTDYTYEVRAKYDDMPPGPFSKTVISKVGS